MYNIKSWKRTVVPVHKKDIPIWTLLAILRQTWLKKEDLFTILNNIFYVFNSRWRWNKEAS